MKMKILATVSALALLASAPSFAEVAAEANVAAKPGSRAAAEQSTGSVRQDVKNAWSDIKKDTKETYNDIKATVVDQNKAGVAPATVTIDPRMTADGMIGKPIYNATGESVATVRDIILDSNGKATMVVVGDGEFIGMGKKAAFDYNAIARVNADGDVIMPLTEEMIDNAAEFSYDQTEDENVRVIPANGYSVAELLESQLVNQRKETIAEVDNITFKNGRADQLIIGFDKILGMGGEKAALKFSEAKIIPDGENDYDFQLSTTQAAEFETYKKTMTN